MLYFIGGILVYFLGFSSGYILGLYNVFENTSRREYLVHGSSSDDGEYIMTDEFLEQKENTIIRNRLMNYYKN